MLSRWPSFLLFDNVKSAGPLRFVLGKNFQHLRLETYDLQQFCETFRIYAFLWKIVEKAVILNTEN